ncbi:hypothetical protein HS7_14910 [Sulfolobales archaeon HS-7]|nr:hypothetical protein HS7_14910 [Sulfolobales archaeon HS-7]
MKKKDQPHDIFDDVWRPSSPKETERVLNVMKLIVEGEDAKAMREIDSMLKENPKNTMPYILKATAETLSGDLNSAIDTLQTARNILPYGDRKRVGIFAMEFTLLEEIRPAKELVEIINKVLEEFPDQAYLLFLRGKTYSRLGKIKKAIHDLNKVIESKDITKRQRAIAVQELAFCHLYRDRFEDSLRELDRSIKEYNTASAHVNKGVVLSAMGRFEDALKEYDEAIKLKPKSKIAHLNKGILLRKIGKKKEALKELLIAKKLTEADLKVEINLLGIYLEMCDKKNAFKELTEIEGIMRESEALAEKYSKMSYREKTELEKSTKATIIGLRTLVIARMTKCDGRNS